MEFAEEIRDFLIESNENLANLDQEIVELEKNPTDAKLIASVFRTIHTIKGTSGFFGFKILGSITHVAENILGQVREKQRDLTPVLVSLVLETVDAVRSVLVNVEENGVEGEDRFAKLRERLEHAYLTLDEPASATPAEEAIGGAPHEERRNAERLEDDRREAKRVAGEQALDRVAEEQSAAAPLAERFEESALAVQESKSAAVEVKPQRREGGEAEQGRRRNEDQSSATSTIRVEVNLLDKLMNLVGELVLARNQILQGTAQSATTSATAQRLNLITSELQEGVMRTRMQPIGVVWNKLPRVVRDLASEMGKKIEIVMEGAETELDKTIIEAIKDPLTHIVRNSCDHGIETTEKRIAKGKKAEGTIHLRAFHEGGHVNIEISDDGAGFDTERMKKKAVEKGLLRAEQAAQMTEWEALRLIFHPGFSTAEKITSISGRGVGMDVVKTNIEKISGTVDLANRAGAGTTIKIKIPLTLAIIPGLIVSIRSKPAKISGSLNGGAPGGIFRQHRFVIPQANLLELVRLESEKDRKQIERIHGAEVYRRRGKLLPLAYLSDVLGLPSVRDAEDVINIVVVKAEDTAFGLVVDEVNDTQEIVVKALGKQLKSLSCYVGATIMGDGRIALILDVTGIARLASMLSQPLDRARAGQKLDGAGAESHQMMLLFRAGRFARLVLPLSLVARLEEIAADRIEYAGGAPVVRYREAILPLISFSSLMDPGSCGAEMKADSLQVIVFNDSGRYVGMVVDEILDIVDDHVTVKRATATFGLLGSGVVGGKVTDFVDLGALLSAAQPELSSAMAAHPEEGKKLLLVDRRKISRGVLRGYLEMQGHQVTEAASLKEALRTVVRNPVDLLLFAVYPGNEHDDRQTMTDLLREWKSKPESSAAMILGLVAGYDARAVAPGRDGGVEALRLAELLDQEVAAADREAILSSIANLTNQARERSASRAETRELVNSGGAQ